MYSRLPSLHACPSLTSCALDRHRCDLLLEKSTLGGGNRFLVAPDCIFILVFSVESVVICTLFTLQTHMLILVDIGQAILQHTINERLIAELGAVSKSLQIMWGVRHALCSASDDHIRLAGQNGRGSQGHGLDGRRADLVNRRCLSGLGKTSEDCALSGRILTQVGLENIAKEYLLHVLGLNAGSLHCSFDCGGAKLNSRLRAQGALKSSYGRASRRQDVYWFWGGHRGGGGDRGRGRTRGKQVKGRVGLAVEVESEQVMKRREEDNGFFYHSTIFFNCTRYRTIPSHRSKQSQGSDARVQAPSQSRSCGGVTVRGPSLLPLRLSIREKVRVHDRVHVCMCVATAPTSPTRRIFHPFALQLTRTSPNMDDLYDEFGNYIGEPEESEDDVDAGADNGAQYLDDDEDEQPATTGQELMEIDDEGPSNAVVLHEDKQYYPSASQIYGPDVETLVQEEDTQTLQQPIVAPVEKQKFTIEETDLPHVYFDRGFMTDLMSFPEQIRNIALCGHLHHGKTSIMDMLVTQTHDLSKFMEGKTGKAHDETIKYTDTHILERERGLSVKASPMSLLLQGTKGKSHLLNIIDTPGHVNFADEVAASLRLVDGVVLVVDVVEGVQVQTELAIKHAVLAGLPLVLMINKVDRLMLELKLPPNDAYFKLKHVVEEVNTFIENTIPGQGEKFRVSPEKGNVAFACSSMEWCFTLPSFATMYAENYPSAEFDVQEFSKRLWGDIYYNPGSRKFTRKGVEDRSKRSFVHFVLEPIYKLYSHTLSESPSDLKKTLGSLGISLKPSQLKANAKDLLKLVCEQFFGPATGFVDMVVQHIPSPVQGARQKLEKYYTGPMDTKTAQSMLECDADGPLVVHVTKLFNTQDAQGFHSFGRVMSGTARPGQQVRVLGENYSIDDEEDMVNATIEQVWIAESRYNVPVSGMPAGNFVLLGGIDNSIMKTATVIAPKLPDEEEAYIFKPVAHFFESVFKVAVEPINPSELPKMLNGLRHINKSYPLITTKVEESGEHVVLGTGELYMDCVLHDLRKLYAQMEIKISDPVTRFCETCVDQSAMKCYALTPNKKNKLTFVAEPLDDGIAEDIESGKVSIKDPVRKVGKFFEENYGYDILASRNIWAFGPDDMGPNILQNDTLPSDVDQKLLRSVKDTIRQGFSWGTREGPLCEEPIRNVKFKITDVELASEAIFRGGGQIIPTARRACYSSFLMAGPRLMEPMYSCTMLGPANSVSSLYTVLARRRGHVLSDAPIPGTPLYSVQGLIPVIDSFGFETDLRIHTQGQATVSLVFDRWQVVPGDPLDKSVKLRPLEPASAQATARDFVLKTRRRKGLSEDVTVSKYVEPEIMRQLRETGMLDGA